MTELFYGEDKAYDVQEYDNVAIVIGDECRIPAIVKAVHVKARAVTLTLDGVGGAADYVKLKKPKVPLAVVEFVSRAG